ncbi:hypothetical protein KR222_010364, partial [Zaprionus bogoriensis]
FERRFGAIERSFLMAASTLLDPRFKQIHFHDPMALAVTMQHIRKEIADLESLESASDEIEFDLWAYHKSLAHKRPKIDPSLVQDELSFFLEAPLLDLNCNVINAWEEMRVVYPKLYIIARRYCFLIGTSVPAERLFSKAGATAAERRNILTTPRLCKLLFLNSVL